MTELGLYFSRSANGVSKLHGQVAQDQFPDFPIDYITNGIYHPYWLGKSFRELFDIKIPKWRTNPDLLLDLNKISDDELHWAHWSQKHFLLSYANSQTQKALAENVLTIGFARRAAEYKRARLIFSDPDRLMRLGKNKLQIVFAGKAHPKDQTGKEIIRQVVENANKLMGKVKIIFLENYNMWLGRLITSGVDVWLNTPLRPNEASGTSGMKAALNGVPNLSILDGWWAEGCKHGENGWAIGSPDICDDELDTESLYQLLEDGVIPTFYNDKQKWNQMMRSSMQTAVNFTAHRMIIEYQQKFYKTHHNEVMNSVK
jgi:starch phosphorylase